MNGKLEDIKYSMSRFIESEELRKKFDDIYEEVVEQNKRNNNFEAFIPVNRIREERRNISELSYGEHYTVLTGSHKDSEGELWSSEDEYKQHMQEKATKIFELYTVIEDANGTFKIHDEEGHLVEDGFDEEEDADDRVLELKEEWLDENVEDLDFEYDEIYWNTVINYYGEVKQDIAEEVGLGVLQMENEDEEEYLFLLGCGMDLTPKFVAYQALAYGQIDEEYVSTFRDLAYTKYVMGEEIFQKVITKLGVADMVNARMNKVQA